MNGAPDLVEPIPALVQEEGRVVGGLVERPVQFSLGQAFRRPTTSGGHQKNNCPLVQTPHVPVVCVV